MTDCCEHESQHSHGKWDPLLWGGLLAVGLSILLSYLMPSSSLFARYGQEVLNLLGMMWWGVAAGIFFSGLLSLVPREAILGVLGKPGSKGGVVRASLAGVLLDMCSHGILLVGMRFYERGASLGQVFAFLVTSPWNSFSLTLIMWSLIGLKATLLFIALSMLVGVSAGWLADWCVGRGTLPRNPATPETLEPFSMAALKANFKQPVSKLISHIVREGIKGSAMLVRWLLVGLLLAAAMRSFITHETMESWFGMGLAGLFTTMVAATIIEVCSEGSAPIAADIFNRAAAPGNAFAFLMAGVSTDYTEILSIREASKSWKTAFFLPLLTLPQVLVFSWLINSFW